MAKKRGKAKQEAVRKPATEQVWVENPYGLVDDAEARHERVTRIVDTVRMMRKRRQIDDRQEHAASIYRRAHAACHGSIPCALDDSRVSGGFGSRTPGDTQLWGAQMMHQAAGILGMIDGTIVEAIAGRGESVEEVALRFFHPGKSGRAKQQDAKHIGRRFRMALTALSDVWIRGERQGVRGHRGEGSVPTGSDARRVEPGRVAHAAADRVT